jgi:hypothetical protein
MEHPSFPEGWVAFHRGVIVTASPEYLIIDIMKIHSFFDAPWGMWGISRPCALFSDVHGETPHLGSDLREGIKLKMDQHATHVLTPVTRRDRDLSRISPLVYGGDVCTIDRDTGSAIRNII